MAVVMKLDGAAGYNLKRAVVGQPTNTPTAGSGAASVLGPNNPPGGSDPTAYFAVLNGRYDVGGTTTWERPAKSG